MLNLVHVKDGWNPDEHQGRRRDQYEGSMRGALWAVIGLVAVAAVAGIASLIL